MGTRARARRVSRSVAAAVLGRIGGRVLLAKVGVRGMRALGQRGGPARAKALSKARRREIALIANQARWDRVRKAQARRT
jgi:hypothetical protein